MATKTKKQYLNNKSFEGIIRSYLCTKKYVARAAMTLDDLRQTASRRAVSEDRMGEANRAYAAVTSEFESYKYELALSFRLLAENITNYYRPYGIDPDDAIQEGVLLCFEKIDRFDPKKGKAFTYLTTCILNHYRQIYRSVKNYQEGKKRYLSHLQDRFSRHVLLGRVDADIPAE